MRTFNLDEVIRLGIKLTEDQKPKKEATVTVTVYNLASPSTPLISAQACTETPADSAYYKYDWTHGLTERTHLRADYVQGDYVFSEEILVRKNIITEIDTQDADFDGRAL